MPCMYSFYPHHNFVGGKAGHSISPVAVAGMVVWCDDSIRYLMYLRVCQSLLVVCGFAVMVDRRSFKMKHVPASDDVLRGFP